MFKRYMFCCILEAGPILLKYVSHFYNPQENVRDGPDMPDMGHIMTLGTYRVAIESKMSEFVTLI